MSGMLTNRSADLGRLESAGLQLRVIEGVAVHLLVNGIPSVNSKREVVFGSLYTPLELDQNRRTVNPLSNHQCWWVGEEIPCHPTGEPMMEWISNPAAEERGDGIRTVCAFSYKLKEQGNYVAYPDYYQKIRAYVGFISAAAREIDPHCNAYSERPVPAVVETQNRVFQYPDSATTRAGIGAATARLLADKVAIIGLGGTGSYILDLLAKVPISEIHLFDGDRFDLHNAYRSPGAPSRDDLGLTSKVDWFSRIYGRMHKGIVGHSYYVTEANVHELEGFDMVFVAIDRGGARKFILEGLMAKGVSFIDVGMGLGQNSDGTISGICRYTVGAPGVYDHVPHVISFVDTPEEGLYRNVQVADMNMLNAALAVMTWKKKRGFYTDNKNEHHGQFGIATGALIKEECR